jgi:hypothetical protein
MNSSILSAAAAADQGILVFLIREPDFESAAGDQRQHDDGHEQEGIFEK